MEEQKLKTNRPATLVLCTTCNQVIEEPLQDRCPRCLQADLRTIPSNAVFIPLRFWFPGFMMAMITGVSSYAICLVNGSDLGSGLFLAVPVSMGAIVGYCTRLGKWALLILTLPLILGTVFILITLNFSGFFCGATLALIFILPVLVGSMFGLFLRNYLKQTQWDQRWFLSIILFVSLPYVVQWIENTFPRREELATVKTKLHIDAGAQEAFRAVMFYEEVEHETPLFLKLSLPKPVRSVGDKTSQGNIVRCYYERGYLVKRISKRIENRLLAFEVIEQKLHFERDVTLKDGSFEIHEINHNKSEIELTTRYQRRLYPRFLWEPIERKVIRSLHHHVLLGMKQAAEKPRSKQQQEIQPYRPGKPASSWHIASNQKAIIFTNSQTRLKNKK